MDIDSCLEKHSAALGDSPAGLWPPPRGGGVQQDGI